MVKRSSAVSLMDLQAWSVKFQTGWDYFGDLGALVPAGQREPDEKQYREAWAALGEAFLANWEPTAHGLKPGAKPAAEIKFGRPWARRRK